MQTKRIHQGPKRVFAIVLETGDEIIECLAQASLLIAGLPV